MVYLDRIYGNCTPHINTGELRDAERVKKLLSSPDIHVAYLLGDGHFWIDYALAQPNIDLIIVRRWNPFNLPDGHRNDWDGQLHQLKSPQEVFNNFLQSGHNQYRNNPRVRWIWGWNEPTHDRNNPAKGLGQLNQWMADIGELFASNGYGVAVGAYAVAKTNSLPTSLDNLKTYIPLFKLSAKYPDLVNWDIHEYECAFLPINYIRNVDTPFPFLFLDKRIADSANWGDIPYEGAGIQSNYKLGNFAEIFEYGESLGYPAVKFGRGEWGTDTMTESWWWNNAIGSNPPFEQTWRSKYGIAPKGLHTLPRYYADLHSDSNWTMQEHNAFAIKQAAWFKENSGKNCLYNTWYAWNTNSLWVTEDISHPDYLIFIDWMQTQQHNVKPKGAPVTIPAPVPTPIETVAKRIRANAASVRIRKDRSTASPILGYLPMSYTDVRYSVKTFPNEGYFWRYLELTMPDSDNVIKGYVADQFIEVDSVTPIPDIVLTETEKHLIAAYRERDYASLIALLNTSQIVILTDDESKLLIAYDERDVRRMLTFTLAIAP